MKSLNPTKEEIRIGILKCLCKTTGLGHAELLKRHGKTLNSYLNQPFNTLLYYKFKSRYNNSVKPNINLLAI